MSIIPNIMVVQKSLKLVCMLYYHIRKVCKSLLFVYTYGGLSNYMGVYCGVCMAAESIWGGSKRQLVGFAFVKDNTCGILTIIISL